MPSDLTPEQRSDALAVVAHEIAGVTHRAEDYADEAERILDALLAAGWRPEPQPDAIAAAEARGRREGIKAAELRAAFEAGRDQAFSEAGARSMGLSFKCPDQAFADHIRALSSIPPQEAPK